MKINIKGFTFVGFAAAIFAMNAMAAVSATNTVTSKSYVDSKISSAGTISSTSTATAPNEKAVYDALYDTTANHDRYQGYSTSANQVSDGAGGWKALGTTLNPTAEGYQSGNAVTAATIVDALAEVGGTVSDSSVSFTQNGASVGSFTVNTASDSIIALPVPNWDAADTAAGYIDNKPTIATAAELINTATSADTKVLPTTYAVNQYVNNAIDSALSSGVAGDSAYISATYDTTTDKTTVSLMSTSIDNAGQVVSGLNSTTGTKLVTDFTLQENLATKQDTTTAVTHTADSAVGDSSTPVYIDSNGAAQPTSLGTAANSDVSQSGVDSGETGLVTGGDVYTYVQSVTGGNTIPAQDPETCTAAHPCALVNEAGALNWRTMAQSGYDGGVCGNLNDNCGDTVKP